MLRSAVIAFAALLALAGSPSAQTAAPNQAEWQSLVRGQIDALRRDDAPAAYAFAAPGIQARFPTPDIFITMVREAYSAVYKPSSVAFGAISSTPAGPVAKVFLTAADGTSWVARYRFERQTDGSWKISACQLLRNTAPSA